MMSHVLSNVLRPQNPAKKLPINIPLISPSLKKKRNMMGFMLLQQIWMILPNIEDMCYMSTYTSSDACTALNAITGLGLDKKYYQPKELNKKIEIILK